MESLSAHRPILGRLARAQTMTIRILASQRHQATSPALHNASRAVCMEAWTLRQMPPSLGSARARHSGFQVAGAPPLDVGAGDEVTQTRGRIHQFGSVVSRRGYGVYQGRAWPSARYFNFRLALSSRLAAPLEDSCPRGKELSRPVPRRAAARKRESSTPSTTAKYHGPPLSRPSHNRRTTGYLMTS